MNQKHLLTIIRTICRSYPCAPRIFKVYYCIGLIQPLERGNPRVNLPLAEGLPGPNRSANLVSVGTMLRREKMAKCVDCGERIAVWEDYCPKCGARKAVTGQVNKKVQAKRKGLGLFGRLKKAL